MDGTLDPIHSISELRPTMICLAVGATTRPAFISQGPFQAETNHPPWICTTPGRINFDETSGNAPPPQSGAFYMLHVNSTLLSQAAQKSFKLGFWCCLSVSPCAVNGLTHCHLRACSVLARRFMPPQARLMHHEKLFTAREWDVQRRRKQGGGIHVIGSIERL